MDLSYNNLNGSIPDIINGTETCNSKSLLPNLRMLDLFQNQLMGKLPNWLGELKNLRKLSLSYNKLEGPIPTSLSLLEGNELSGTLFKQHFLKLSNLKSLNLDNFRLNVSSNWVPPFKLRYLYMYSCHVGPAFPTWLQSQKNLQYLYLSNASISSSIPNWFWNTFVNLQSLDLSSNQLQG